MIGHKGEWCLVYLDELQADQAYLCVYKWEPSLIQHDILPDTPPPPQPSDHSPNDWTPNNNCVKFEVADFTYHRNQMSVGDAEFIFHL